MFLQSAQVKVHPVPWTQLTFVFNIVCFTSLGPFPPPPLRDSCPLPFSNVSVNLSPQGTQPDRVSVCMWDIFEEQLFLSASLFVCVVLMVQCSVELGAVPGGGGVSGSSFCGLNVSSSTSSVNPQQWPAFGSTLTTSSTDIRQIILIIFVKHFILVWLTWNKDGDGWCPRPSGDQCGRMHIIYHHVTALSPGTWFKHLSLTYDSEQRWIFLLSVCWFFEIECSSLFIWVLSTFPALWWFCRRPHYYYYDYSLLSLVLKRP